MATIVIAPRDMKSSGKRDTRIPRKPLLWLTAALFFTLPPMFGALSTWVPVLFLVALVAKFWMEPKGHRLRSVAAKLALAVIALVAIYFSYGSIQGIEPGVSLIVLLMSIKIMEAHTAREFQVMVMIAFVLCLCGFFLSQDLTIALSLFVAFTLLIVALVQFHRGPSSTIWLPIRTAFKLIAQAAPIVALLFLFFPRISTGFRLQFAQSRNGGTGFSGKLSPGSVTSLAGTSEIAFRAEFPEGRTPPSSAMYWRGVAMWRCEGLEWHAPETPVARPRTNSPEIASKGIRQAITIEPHHGHWMFALDWPVTSPPGSFLTPGNYLWSGQPLHRQHRYEVTSIPELRDKQLHDRERKLLLQVSGTITENVWSLVQSWKTGNSDPRAIVNNGLRYFQTGGFRYSLSPGEYGKGDLEEFLFRRKLGFCEHYAAAFATLMRLAGVPARVVTGYLGGEYNEIGNFFVVRQSDAHAWCEVWLPQSGWERVDPTAVVAPDRVNLGLNGFLERAANGQVQVQAALTKRFGRWPFFARTRLAWQSLKYSWDTHVVSFDSEAQESFVTGLGLENYGAVSWLTGMLAVTIAVLGVYAVWARIRTKSPIDQVKALYETFCRKAARLGALRLPSEGPRDFCARATGLLPNESHRIRTIVDAYVALRYAAQPDRRLINHFAREVVLFGRGAK